MNTHHIVSPSYIQILNRVFSDKEEQLWVWEYEAEDGKHDMYMDIDEEIRFRVIKETFVDTSPTSSMCTIISQESQVRSL